MQSQLMHLAIQLTVSNCFCLSAPTVPLPEQTDPVPRWLRLWSAPRDVGTLQEPSVPTNVLDNHNAPSNLRTRATIQRPATLPITERLGLSAFYIIWDPLSWSHCTTLSRALSKMRPPTPPTYLKLVRAIYIIRHESFSLRYPVQLVVI